MEGLKEMLSKHRENHAALSVITGLPEGVYFELINLNDLKRSHTAGEDRHRSEFCSLYIFEHPELFKILTLPISQKTLHRPDIRLTVDYPEDLIVVREVYKALKREGKFITIEEIIQYLDQHRQQLTSLH